MAFFLLDRYCSKELGVEEAIIDWEDLHDEYRDFLISTMPEQIVTLNDNYDIADAELLDFDECEEECFAHKAHLILPIYQVMTTKGQSKLYWYFKSFEDNSNLILGYGNAHLYVTKIDIPPEISSLSNVVAFDEFTAITPKALRYNHIVYLKSGYVVDIEFDSFSYTVW